MNGDPEKKDYIFEAKGGGVGFFDFDLDGWQDIFLVQGSTLDLAKAGGGPGCALYRNRGDGAFEDVTEKAGIRGRSWGMGVAFGDYDGNGFPDIYLTNLGPNTLYRNNGDGTFTDVTASAGVGDPRWSTSAAFGDADGDGDLDLYVANYLDYGIDRLPPRSEVCTYLGRPVLCGPRGLAGAGDSYYQNNGDGTFREAAEESGAVDKDRYFGLGVVWSDLDGDGDLDLFVANDATPNLLFVNDGKGRFEELGFLSGLAVSGDGAMQASMGIAVGDYDNDGRFDLFVTHFAGDYSTLYRNLGEMFFKDSSGEAGLQGPEWLMVGWGTKFVDVDNDGRQDILHLNGHVYPFLLDGSSKEKYLQPPVLYWNRGDGTFEDVSPSAGPDFLVPKASRGAAFADYDNDGDLDLLAANINDSPRLLRNDRKDRNHWVMIRLEGAPPNRDAIGATVRIRTGASRQIGEVRRTEGIYSSGDPRLHFGIGAAESLEELEVHWPGGGVSQFRSIPADRHLLIRKDSRSVEQEPFRRPRP